MKRNGFTLVEILIVIVIVFILAAIFLPRWLGWEQRAKESRLKTDLKALRDCIEAYELQEGKYPTSLTDLTAMENKSTGEPFLDEIPVDPTTDLAEYDYDPQSGEVHSMAEGSTLDGTPYQDL